MHDIAPHSRLADVVTYHPPLARELERLGLDYCCGGLRKLSEACEELGLDPDRVAGELRTVAAAADDGPAEWAMMGLSQLVDHLETTHHRYLWDELPRIAGLVEKVVAAHAERHPELYAVADTFHALHAELVPHLQKEETVLFPMIRELATADELPSFQCGSVANPISEMLREHDQAGELLLTLREITGEYRAPDDGCSTYWTLYDALAHLEADTHLHVHKENNLLFPAVTSVERRLVAG